jgi:hypothetical protein
MALGRYGNVLTVAALLLAVAVVFGRGLDNGFVYDDYWLVESNPALRDPGPLARFLGSPLFADMLRPDDAVWAKGGIEYWRPFVKFALLVQHRLFAGRAAGFHAVSLVVHAASVVLLFVWLWRRLASGPAPVSRRQTPARLAGAPADPRRTLAAGLGAALFALHPVRVESVAWVSGCTDLWMVFWVLVGLVAWQRPGRSATLAASAAFALAALAKETALVVPAGLALDAWAARRLDRTAWRRLAAPTAALAAVLVVWFVLLPPSPGGARFGGIPRILTSIALYAGRVVWPVHPSTQVGVMDADGRFAFGVANLVAGALLVVAIAGFTFAARRRLAWRPWLADLGWVVLPLLPVLNVIAIGYTTLVAERFLALPLVGIAALAARAVTTAPRAAVPVAASAGAAAAVAGGVISARYIPHLRDNASLWRYETRLAPSQPNLYLYLANAEVSAGRLAASQQAALAGYARAATPDLRVWTALAWARARLLELSDADQVELVRLRQFYDDLLERRSADLDAGGVALHAAPTRTVHELVRRSAAVRTARILTHARTSSLAVAESLLRDAIRDRPTAATAANYVRVMALQMRLGDAAAARAEALQLFPNDPDLVRLGAAIAGAERWLRGAEPNALRRDTGRVLLWLYFGSLPLARSTLAPLVAQHPDAVETAVVAHLVDAAGGHADAAREALLRRRSNDPANAALYEWALGQIAAVARREAVPLQADVGALFR